MDHLDIDKLTRKLLQKGLQKPLSPDFDDQVMKKIILSPAPFNPRDNRIYTKKAWIFWAIAIVLFLFSLTVFSEILSNYFVDGSDIFKLTINYVFYGGLALFVPLFLYYFDALAQLMFHKKEREISMI